MSSQDYLLRQFQQLGKVLANLAGLREKKKHQLVLKEIDQLMLNWFELETNQVGYMSVDDIVSHVEGLKNSSDEVLSSLAEIIFQKTVTLNEMNEKEEAKTMALLSIDLLKYIESEGDYFSFDQQQKITILDKILSGA